MDTKYGPNWHCVVGKQLNTNHIHFQKLIFNSNNRKIIQWIHEL